MEQRPSELFSIRTDKAPQPLGHYNQAIRLGDMLYVSGQLPIRPDGTHTNELPFEEQAAQALGNVLAIIRAGGGSPECVIKTTSYIVDIKNWPTLNVIYASMFGNWKPVRVVVPVPQLRHGYLIEVDAIAIISVASHPVKAD
jgi:2-iminobutanoate/2-iminopropanoate deaminase